MTKAAASAARAQPAESRDRKYDKHLSYSATWGRLAGQAGSRGRGAGVDGEREKSDPGARYPRCPRGFRDRRPGRAGAARPKLRRSPMPASPDRRVALGVSEGRDGSSGWRWGQIPLECGVLSPTLEMGHQVKSAFIGTGLKRLCSLRGRLRPRCKPGRAHAGRDAWLGDAGRT